MQQSGSLRRRMLFASTALGVLIGAAFVILIVTLRNVRDQQRARGHSETVIASANPAPNELVSRMKSPRLKTADSTIYPSAAARWIAARIRSYVPQRQMLVIA